MLRRLSRVLLASAVIAVGLIHVRADGREASPRNSALLQKFLSLPDPAPTSYRALRHLDAANERFDSTAWMDVWTEADAQNGFRYQIAAEGGSNYIRGHVFRETLEAERRLWVSGAMQRAALTLDNYAFEECASADDGLASLIVRPRRKDVLLVNGHIFLNRDDGDLVRVEGELSKSPSFWTRRVEVARWYRRFAGVRLPVAFETTAAVRIAGQSTFRMEYEYENVNGERVGTPHVRNQVVSGS
jgi:hypothetical protein